MRTGCFGMCEAGPVVIVYPEGAFYARMTVENVTRIVDEHLVKGRVVKELLYKEAVDEDNKVKSLDSVDFYKKQRRVALRNCGVIDPENIDEYIAFDGYKALGKVLTEMTPAGGHRRDAQIRPARPRRRGLPHRHEVEICRRLSVG